jgi:ferredoxin
MILYFSGTGNSRWVAMQLASLLEDIAHDIAETLKDVTDSKIIWVFPIYSWGLPPVVKQFIRNQRLKFHPETVHHMVCTCGDDIGFAHELWRKEIRKNHLGVAGDAFSVIMPNTYTLMKGFDVDTPEIKNQKLLAASDRVKYVARQISSHQSRQEFITDVTKGSWAWMKTHVIYPYFMRFCMSPKLFHATHDCISCGRCAKECPLHNIVMIERQPKWGGNCTMCLRCYHTCPQHAVAYGKATRCKGQYLHP